MKRLSARGLCLDRGRKRLCGCRSDYEGDDAREGVDENNPRVKAIRERIQVKADKKQAMNFLTKLD